MENIEFKRVTAKMPRKYLVEVPINIKKQCK